MQDKTIFHTFFKDADAVARQILEPGQPAFKEIQDTFGQSVIDQTTGKIVSDWLSEYFSFSLLL